MRGRLLHDIIALDYMRILQRLKSTHTPKAPKNTTKPSPVKLLNQKLKDPLVVSGTRASKSTMRDLRMYARGLERSFNDFEATSQHDSGAPHTRSMLSSIIQQAYDLTKQINVEFVFSNIRKFDPSIGSGVQRGLGKIGRYFEISYNLINAARSNSLVDLRRVTIRSLNQPQAPERLLEDIPRSFDAAARQIKSSAGYSLKRKFLREQTDQVHLNNQYNKLIDTNHRGRVHAEIQILLFYEQLPTVRLPRIISSSKSACFLCHLFISLHGRYLVPHTHGRLYPAWALPRWPINIPDDRQRDLSGTLERMNANLGSQAIAQLQTERSITYYPNESLLNEHAPWSSVSTIKEPHLDVNQVLGEQVERSPSTLSSWTIGKSIKSHEGQAEIERYPIDTFDMNIPDVEFRKQWTCVFSPAAVEHSMHIPGLNVTLSRESPVDGMTAESGSENLQVVVRHMSAQSERQSLVHEDHCIDIDQISPGVGLKVARGATLNSESLILRRKSDFLSIQYR